jgi:hypothetical protein
MSLAADWGFGRVTENEGNFIESLGISSTLPTAYVIVANRSESPLLKTEN